MTWPDEHQSGRREHNRVATRQRIADCAFALFETQGYDGTTLEQVARAADISPRTLYHYFATKDALVDFFRASDFDQALAAELRIGCEGKRPLAALCDCLIDLVGRYDSDQGVRIDRLLNSTESLRIRKQQVFLDWERVAFDTLCECFEGRVSSEDISVVSMIGIGSLRLALTRRRQADDPMPLVSYLRDALASVTRTTDPT